MTTPAALSPAARHDPLVASTVELDPERTPALADLLGPDSVAWLRDGEGLVGRGVAARLEVDGAERFSRAQRWWSELVARTARGGEGPYAFVSFAFDPCSRVPSVVVVPEVVVRRRSAGTTVTAVGTAERVEELLAAPLPRPTAAAAPARVGAVEGDGDEWTRAVAGAVRRIDAGALDKVVLAREVLAHADSDVDPRDVLRRLAAAYPSCWGFLVDGLVGATPELLVRRQGTHVSSRVLAGTIRRATDTGGDDSLASRLMASAKDRAEHEYAVRSVARSLAAHCTDLDVPGTPSLLRLPNVQHLATDIRGELADGSSVLALAASLHPTAAVCGTPTERALDLIRELEHLDRGRYAGPVGWCDADGDGELGIALRCGLVAGRTVRMYAGCGIVAGSDPAAELAESEAKLRPVREALLLPTQGAPPV